MLLGSLVGISCCHFVEGIQKKAHVSDFEREGHERNGSCICIFSQLNQLPWAVLHSCDKRVPLPQHQVIWFPNGQPPQGSKVVGCIILVVKRITIDRPKASVNINQQQINQDKLTFLSIAPQNQTPFIEQMMQILFKKSICLFYLQTFLSPINWLYSLSS